MNERNPASGRPGPAILRSAPTDPDPSPVDDLSDDDEILDWRGL